MLTRIAIYEGKIKPGQEEIFFKRVREELEPIWARFPGVTAVRVLRSQTSDQDALSIPMILEMDFPDMAAIDACLASPIRPQAHAATEAVMKLFDGRFYHLIAEAKKLPAATG
jgi:antibiotic biosynthesis monooxygenase (ABM) superfamily enzyme